MFRLRKAGNFINKKTGGRNMKKIITILTSIILLTVVGIMIMFGDHQEKVSAENTGSDAAYQQNDKEIPSTINLVNHTNSEKIIDDKKKKQDKVKEETELEKLTHEKIVALTDGFMDTLVADIDENYQLVEYNTIEQLEKAFLRYAKPGVAEPYIDFYFEEKDGAVYIVPTETPPWFVEENEYTLNAISDQKYLLTQTNTIELYGTYTIQIEFELENKEWKISKILHD